jgi:hypothetical protein
MEFTFHNSYVILELVPSIVIFWTLLSCRRKTYPNKVTLHIGWSHPYKHSTVVITIWLTVTKYHISNDNGNFTFYEMFSFLYHCQEFYQIWLYIWVTRLTLRENLSSFPFVGRVRVGNPFSLLCCLMCLYGLRSVLWCSLRFPHKNYVRFVFTSSCL